MRLLFIGMMLTVVIPSMATAETGAFSEYRNRTIEQLREARRSQGFDEETVFLNAPQEWRPPNSSRHSRPEKGILLVHGLGDSPFSFTDIGADLAAQGFLVRTVLLPGHGTNPDDMLRVSVKQWRATVSEQVSQLRSDVGQVYLGGFSTGANLVTEYAYLNPDIAGLLLFSPAFKSSTPLDWMTPLIGWARPWLLVPEAGTPLQNAVRYTMVPTNGFAQFYRSSQSARRLLNARTYDKPVFMVVAEHDSVLDSKYLLKTFQKRFTHPASRLVWYGSNAGKFTDRRVIVRSDRIPDQRISQFSHMGVLFSPSNRLYGERGSLRMCRNGGDTASTQACENGSEVWYSDWGYMEPNKIHARLTFNPYFVWQNTIMHSVLDSAKM